MKSNEITRNGFSRRKPGIAILFSLICPCLAQIYNGQILKALLIIFFEISLFFILFIHTIKSFTGLLIIISTYIVFFFIILIDSVIVSNKLETYKLKKYNKWYVYLIFYVLVLLLNKGFSTHLKNNFETYKIPNSSMENSLLIGDYLVSNQKYYETNDIHRFDLVIFKFPDKNKDSVKRVYGLPGEKIELKDKTIYINDKQIQNDFIKNIDRRFIKKNDGNLFLDESFMGSRDNFGPYIVPLNSYFVLGDNLDVSADSRYVGCIKKDEIFGKPLYIYLSYGTTPINDFKEYVIKFNKDREMVFRKSRIGKRVE